MQDGHSTTRTNVDQLNSLLSKLKKKNIIDAKTYSSLFTSGSRPGILYGLLKIHKSNLPIHLILSALETIHYKDFKFFIPLLKKLSMNQHIINNIFTFIQNLIDIPNANEYVLASFDITNLFTNVQIYMRQLISL